MRGGAKANVPFVCVLILKFLREGKVSVKDTEFSCHDEAFLKAGNSPAITNRNAVYLHFRLAHNGWPVSAVRLTAQSYSVCKYFRKI